MPSGAGPGGGFLFSTVGRNRCDVAASAAGSAWSADGLGRVAVKATIAAAAIVTTATHVHALLLRRGTDTVLFGFERRLLICGPGRITRMCRLPFRSSNSIADSAPHPRPAGPATKYRGSGVQFGDSPCEFVEPRAATVGHNRARSAGDRLDEPSPSCPERQRRPCLEDCERDAGHSCRGVVVRGREELREGTPEKLLWCRPVVFRPPHVLLLSSACGTGTRMPVPLDEHGPPTSAAGRRQRGHR